MGNDMQMSKITNSVSITTMLQIIGMLAVVGSTVWYLQGQNNATVLIAAANADDLVAMTAIQHQLAERTRLLESIVSANAVRHEVIKKDIQFIKDGQLDINRLLLQLIQQGTNR